MLPQSAVRIESLGELLFRDPFRTRELELLYAWGVRCNKVDYRCPARLRSDGASIPRLFWRTVDPPFYTLLRPGVILHDAAYQGLLRATGPGGDFMPVERCEADMLMALVARWNGAARWRVHVVYHTLRICGRPAWRASHARYSQVNPRKLSYELAMPNCPPPSMN